MSGSDPNGAIYLSDTPKQVVTKINKHAFSGGQSTVELHRKIGGDPEVDVAFQYLKYFDFENDIEKIKVDYKTGKLLTGELKKRTIGIINNMLLKHQQRKKEISVHRF